MTAIPSVWTTHRPGFTRFPSSFGRRRTVSTAQVRPEQRAITRFPLIRASFLLMCAMLLSVGAVHAQEAMQSGEAFVTRFSGTTEQDGRRVIDPAGAVASILELRQPGGPPRGEHWFNELQRGVVTAGEIGQVFGVALDDATPPNIYVTATAAFGLHRTADNTDWMPGMWGADGSPGTVWKLDAQNNYIPEVFARIELAGRPNSGAGLGNIAFDRWNRQFFVSDLETGMIHRLRHADGADLGAFDHGVSGRAAFVDILEETVRSLPPVPFDPENRARIEDCPSGDFARTPSCWNLADFRRRVWGVGVRRDAVSEEVRVYYAVWSSQGFGNPDYANASEDEQRNALWSVGIEPDGSFNANSARREFLLPDFFRSPEAIARAGRSHPVSDIAFPVHGAQTVMLIAERGGMRNRGLAADNAFTYPHEARVLRYELTAQGNWRSAGRYDVGYYDRSEDGPPYIRAGSAGGVSFGLGFGESWENDPTRTDAFVWMSGDELCSPRGLCFDSSANEHTDSSNVHGLQGRAATPYDAFEPFTAFQPYPAPGPATPATGPDSSFMVDADVNIDDAGNAIEEQRTRNDVSRIGNVAIFQAAPLEGAEVSAPGFVDDYPFGGEPPLAGYLPGDLPPEGWYPAPPPPPGGWFPLPPFPLVDVDLAIHKTGPAQCQEGVNCAYTITIANLGPGPYAGPLAVVDTMPTGATLATGSAGWHCDVAGAEVSCRSLGPVFLGAGGTAALTLTVLLPADVPGPFVHNCVAIDWWEMGTTDGPGDGNDTHCIDTPVTDGFDLGIAKNGPVACTENAVCLFDLSITNHGPGEFNGVLAVSDNLPAGATLDNASFGGWAASCHDAGGIVECTGGPVTIPNGGTVNIVLRLLLPDGIAPVVATNCANIDWASMTANDGAADVHADDDCHSLNVIDGAGFFDLFVKKYGPASCIAGANCEYTLTVTNQGSDDYMGEVVLRDTPPAGSTFVSADPDWACVGLPIECTLAAGPHTLHPGDTEGLTLTVAISNPVPSDPLTNCMDLAWGVGGMPADDNPAPPGIDFLDSNCLLTDSAETFDFEIAKAGPAVCYEGSVCDYSISLTNHGPRPYHGYLAYRDTLPLGATFEGALGDMVCRTGAGVVECSGFYWGLAPGTTLEQTFSVRLPDPVAGDTVENCAQLLWGPLPLGGYGSAALSDGNAATDGPVCVTTPVLAADLSPYSATTCHVGQPCEVSVLLENMGGRRFEGSAGFTGRLDPTVAISSFKEQTQGLSCRVTGEGAYECHGEQLSIKPGRKNAPRATMVLDIPADFPHPRIEHFREMIWPDERVKDKRPINDRTTSTIRILQPDETRVLAPPREVAPTTQNVDLVVDKQGPTSCSAGGDCRYTISVTNAGPDAYSGIVYLFDTYPGYLESSFVSASAGWACFDAHGAVECRRHVTELGIGESVTLEITVRLADNIASHPDTRAEGGARNCVRLGWPGEFLSDDRHRAFWVERALVQAGHLEAAAVDGVLGAAEARAIRAWQAANGLAQTGVADDALWNAMFPHAGQMNGDSNTANDNDCVVTPLAEETPPQEIPPVAQPPRRLPVPDLQLSKTAGQQSCDAGAPCDFLITVTNNGPGAFRGPLQLNDDFASRGARLISSGPRPWRCRTGRGGVNCTHPVTTLRAGQSLTLSLGFETSRNAGGRARNCVAFAWGGGGQVRAVQTALNELGFDAGPADGKAGRRTSGAVRAYQESVGMRATGRIDQALLRRLFANWAEGDSNAANDNACVSVDVRRRAAPPPPPLVCPPGYTAYTNKNRIPRNSVVERLARGNQVLFCARPRAAALTCPPGYKAYRNKNQIPRNSVVERLVRGNQVLFCARQRRVEPRPQPQPQAQNCPRGWQKVSGSRAKTLVQQGWQIRQVGDQLCGRRAQVTPTQPPRPACTGGRVWSQRRNACVCPRNTRWNQRQKRCVKAKAPPRTSPQTQSPQKQAPQRRAPQIQITPNLKLILPPSVQ